MKIGNPIKYLAVKPEIILERVKKDIKDEADQQATQIESIKETDEFKELELLHKTGVQHIDITSISKSIVGRTTINRFIKDMASRTKSSLLIVSTNQHIERYAKLLKNFMPSISKKEIEARIYGPYIKSASRRLQNISYTEYNSNTSFISIDGKEMLFMVSNDSAAPDYEVAIWISSPFFVNAVSVLFEASLK